MHRVHEIEIDFSVWGSPVIYVKDSSGWILQEVKLKKEEQAYEIAAKMYSEWKKELNKKDKNDNSKTERTDSEER